MSDEKAASMYPPYVTTERELKEREGDLGNRQGLPANMGGAGEMGGGDTEPDVRQTPAVAASEEAHNQQENGQRKGAQSSQP